jgi:ATP-dependent helicase/nuclease subunit B
MAALKELPETAQAAQRLERSFDTKRGRLTPQGVEELYTNTIRLSASKMDKLKGCHFSYFMQYGLKAKARKAAGFSAPEAGDFVHDVLESVLKKAKEKGGVAKCSDEEIKKMIRQAVASYVRYKLGGMEDKTRRFQYLFRRLLKSVEQVVHNVVDELRHSEFQPIDFELGFGQDGQTPVQVQCGKLTLSITGFVDRVDGWYHDGRLYYRVVDYKTGKKSFDFTDVWNGLGLQMLIYLFALQEKGEFTLGTQDPIPAGVLYLPARDVIVPGDRDISEEERQKQVDKRLVRSGLLLKDEQVLQAMEQAGAEGIRFLPIRVNKGGAISGDSLASAAQMGQLKKHIEKILHQIGTEFATGNVDADPYYHGERTACNYCDYAAACHFEEGESGNCRRYLPSVSAKEFWEKVEQETEGKEEER